MSELRFEAPLANFDSEDWDEFVEDEQKDFLVNNAALKHQNNDLMDSGFQSVIISQNLKSSASADFSDETPTGSLENLVNNFDSSVSKCVNNMNESVNEIAPVQARTEDEVIKDCQSWWTLTGQYGNLLPISWSKKFNLMSPTSDMDYIFGEEQDKEDFNCQMEDLYNDQDLKNYLGNEMFESADDVIDELEAMIEDDFIEKQINNDLSDEKVEIYHWSLDALKCLTIAGLKQVVTDVDENIKHVTKRTLNALKINDDYKYERELKNAFICLVISIQNKRRQVVSTNKSNDIYVTTVIPYKSSIDLISVHLLQIYVKLLMAIDQNSPVVPKLLTDYILKVLCTSQ